MLALIISVMVHGALMPFSRVSHDLAFDLAHFLKALSYICVLVGLLSSVYTTMRREGEAAHVAQAANTALAKEIDTRRKAERILQESEERLQDFLDNAHDLIQSVDPQGKLLYVNRAWERTLGYGEEDRKDLNFFDILDESCRDRCIRDFRSVLDGASLPMVEVSLRARDGRIVFCSGSANARFEDGKPVATRTIFRDISESRAARRELEAFQANLQALVENTGDAIWSVNRALQLITFNTAFSMTLEVRTGREPGMGDLPEDVFPEEDAVWYREMYQRALKGEAFSELRDEEIGGQTRSLELFFNPIREAMGITGVAIFGKDVTARRRTQLALRIAKEEAERANQAKSQFLANMSHELRTPLNSVIGFTNVLLKNRSGKLDSKELGFLERISANGRHLLELINEVLDLAKIEAGRMELDLQSVDLGKLIQETLAQMEGQVRDKDLALRTDIPDGLPPLETDSGKLKQVLINLVGNALKFTEKGEVVVQVATLPDRSAISSVSVRDSGIGIPPERLKAIFEAFQQADGTTTRRFGGTGLGLTISRSLCQLMGYDLKVESTEGEGSVFTIRMANVPPRPKASKELLIEEALQPIHSSRPRRESQESASGSRGAAKVGRRKQKQKKRVLVIDDEADSRLLLTHLLEDLQFQVETASSAADGLGKVRSWSPNLILLDLAMPEVGGLEFLSWLREREELMGLPIVVCTAKELNRTERIQLQEQVYGVVFKGKNLEKDLRAALARFLPSTSTGPGTPG
jgi:PAS domain S-box-containing protein